jgi:para-nitrobenzyl esterase
MVWIHGGGFRLGSGHQGGVHSGEHIVPAGDVVLVTLNYRLGALGYLAHAALTAESAARPTSGNYGHEDQRFALEWVRDNIAAFGGDPNNVTIFGESAGGLSVCSHMVSPESAGLFDAAIIQSGPCSTFSTTLSDAEAQGDRFASAVGCDTAADVAACLRGVAVDDALNALPPDPSFVLDDNSWGPNIDGIVMLEPPADSLTSGAFNKVPLIIGSNANEGTLFINFGGLGDIDEPTYQQIVTDLSLARGVDAALVLAEYPASDYATPGAALAALVGEVAFNCPSRTVARLVSSHGVATFLYHFEYEPDFTALGDLGAFHSADVAYVFGTAVLGIQPVTSAEQPLVDAMMGYWTGLHGGSPGDAGGVSWPAYASDSDMHLTLDLNAIASGSQLRQAKCDFWDGLN